MFSSRALTPPPPGRAERNVPRDDGRPDAVPRSVRTYRRRRRTRWVKNAARMTTVVVAAAVIATGYRARYKIWSAPQHRYVSSKSVTVILCIVLSLETLKIRNFHWVHKNHTAIIFWVCVVRWQLSRYLSTSYYCYDKE